MALPLFVCLQVKALGASGSGLRLRMNLLFQFDKREFSNAHIQHHHRSI